MDGGGIAAVLLADANGQIVDSSGTGLDSLEPRGDSLVGSPLDSLESGGTRLILPGHLEGAQRDGESRHEVRCPSREDGPPFTVHLRSLEVNGTRLLRASISRPDGRSDEGSGKASRARESLLRAIIDNLPFEFFARDTDEVCFLENPALARHWGTLLGMRPEDAKITPEELATWKATNRRALSGEVIHSEVTWDIRGERRAFDEVVAPIQLDGEVLGFLGLGIDVTERKRAEEGLRRREAEIRALVENTEDRIWSIDREYRLVVSNHHIDADLTVRLGRPIRPGECVFHEGLPGWMNEAWRKHYDRALRGESFVVERQTSFLNPSEWWEFRIGPIRDDRGEVTGVLVIQRNITREKETRTALEQSRAELAESESRYRNIFENAAEGIFLTSPDGRLLSANPACARIFGFESVPAMLAAVTSVTDQLYASADDRARFRDLLERDGEVQGFQTPIHRRDGTRGWVSLTARVVRDVDGKSLWYEGMVEDISERKAGEETHQREAAMDRALSSLYRPVVSPETDVPAIARVVFEQALRLTGSTLAFVAEINPATWAASPHVISGVMEDDPGNRRASEAISFPRGDDGSYGGLWGHPLNTRKGYFTNAPASHFAAAGAPAGHVRLDRFLAVPVQAGDELLGEIALANAPADYTDRDLKAIERLAEFYALGIQRKRVEAQVRSLAESLETRVRERTAELLAANQELEAFSYSVSHDLRAPLRAIVGFTQAVLEDTGPSLPSGAVEDLRRAVAAAQRMSHLIDGLLGLSRLTRREMQTGPVDLSSLAREVVDEQRSLQPGRSVETTVEDGLAVHGDRELLRLVFRNLLENAWKFTSRTPGARVEVGSTTTEPAPPGREAGRRAYFVRDNGVGFDMAYTDKLFRPFHRLHAEAEFPGSGIGLASAQRIVRRHGGTIWARSAPGAGATFFFTLEERR